MLNKKGDVDPLKVIISIVLLLIVALIIIFVFREKFGKQVGIIDTILGRQEEDISKLPNPFENGEPSSIAGFEEMLLRGKSHALVT